MKLVLSDGTEYPLDRPQVTLGREVDNVIVLTDGRVSSHHAFIEQAGADYVLRDNNSTNGTYVNNIRIAAPYLLRLGDVISLGGITLTAQDDYAFSNAAARANRTIYDPAPPSAFSPVSPAGEPTPYSGAQVYPQPSYGAQPYPVPPQYPPAPAYPPPQQYAAPQAYGYPYNPNLKDRSMATILEILPGLFGFLGIGWIYAGQTGTGIAILIGNWVYIAIAALFSAITAGIAACILLPIEIGFLLWSVVSLNNYTKSHPELFKP